MEVASVPPGPFQQPIVQVRHMFLETASLQGPPALLRARAMSDSFLVDHACAYERQLLASEHLDEQDDLSDTASTTSTALPWQDEFVIDEASSESHDDDEEGLFSDTDVEDPTATDCGEAPLEDCHLSDAS
eukprot:CAMPEP_0178371112 /NCGR_PEP_ID=MMETSP0689_2-20121128/656_1 /TAXON_ID=160604 /ORGANISM="Amphidinium massartii, Strain CS-259" /LENGTH=130 /DNA_ID=CAMNT_0019990967 /DNA_START=27 /DNA_END=416 /DNA_ORIENTATION=-